MQNEAGKNIYKDFINQVQSAKDTFEKVGNNINNSLSACIEMVKNSHRIEDVLTNELILLQNFDIIFCNNNYEKINNRVNLCNLAFDEYNLFNTDKEKYLEKLHERNRFNSKGIDINKDSIFELSIKSLTISLGKEKKLAFTYPQIVELYEIRQNKLREIRKEFTKEYKAFLSKHISQ